MFGDALDNMLSQYGGGQQPMNNTPPLYGGGGRGGPQPIGYSGGGAPGSFFSAASPITAGAISTGSSPFGAPVPDISRLTQQQLSYIEKTLSGLVYSAPLGGYITRAEANDPNSAYVKGYYGKPMTGGDAGANRLAQSVYGLIGNLPTRPIGTPALNSLPGYSPTPGTPFNQRLGSSGPYGGPWSFPGWP